jgi:hypothetical protein
VYEASGLTWPSPHLSTSKHFLNIHQRKKNTIASNAAGNEKNALYVKLFRTIL